MELFTYLMAKNDHNTSVKKDLFSYLLGKNQSGTYTDYSGTSLSINNTKKAKMKVNLLGNTSQTGTPTPDNPIPVNVVSGDNEVVVCGKNLIDSIEYNKYVSGSGNVTSGNTDYLGINDYISCEPSTEYTISFQHDNVSGQLYVAYKDKDNNFISIQSYSTSRTFTTPNNAYYLYAYIYKSSTFITVGGYVMLNKGSTASTYEPYKSSTYPIHLGTYELCKIGTYQDKFIRNSGKNLFDGEIELGSIYPSSGIPWDDSSRTRSKNYIKVKPNTTYYFKRQTGLWRWIIGYKSDKSAITDGGSDGYAAAIYNTNQKEFTFTTTATTEYIKWYDNNNTDLTEKVMISLQDIPYEPYGNGDLYLEKHIGKVVLNGSETNWGLQNSVEYYLDLRGLLPIPIADSSIVGCVCNNYLGVSRNTQYTLTLNVCCANGNFMRFNDDRFETLEQYKTWLSTHNTEIVYALATPTYTKIEGTLKDELEAVWRAYSYKGQTNISQINNDLPFELNVSVKVGS